MSRGLRRMAMVGACSLAAGCFGGTHIKPEERDIDVPMLDLAFQPAGAIVLDGLYESVDIQGDMALSWRKVYYLFSPNGSYTAAALGDGDAGPAFTTLTGTWKCEARGLSLDDAEPLPLEQAPGHLRLSAAGGSLVLAQRKLP